MANLSWSTDKKTGDLVGISTTLNDLRILEFLIFYSRTILESTFLAFLKERDELLIPLFKRKRKTVYEATDDPGSGVFSIYLIYFTFLISECLV